jgi:hypothetical protein
MGISPLGAITMLLLMLLELALLPLLSISP